MSEILISIENISKRYKGAEDFSLRNVSLSILNGDKFGILGPNGAGKTTLVSILCGITEATHGNISINIPHPENIKKQIGFVPQDFAFYEELTANQNLEYFGALYSISKKNIKTRINDLLSILGLLQVANKKVKTYSGGMKRRLNLAIGIIHNPTILFLDEPTVGIDIQSKNAILNFLNELNANGTTIIYTSHHLSEAEHFCNNIAILDSGKVIANNTIEGLKQEYNSQNLKEVVLHLTGEGYRDNV